MVLRNLDDIITIPIPEEIVQKHKDGFDNIELPTDEYGNKTKSYNLFKDVKNSGHALLQNKDSPDEMFETAIHTSNEGTTSIHDALIAHN